MALRPISRMQSYSLPEGAYDVRGWTVRTQLDEEKVGRVEDLLLDGEGRLRYLHVDLGFLRKHVLVPLERAHADSAEEVVWLESMTRERLESMPEYGRDPESVPGAFEQRVTDFYHQVAGSDDPVQAPPAPPLELDPDPEDEVPLSRLGDLDDYQVAGESDPRGWALLTGDGREVGRVVELLVDTGELTTRYLDVALDEPALDLEPVDRHVLIPVEQVRLDPRKKRALVAGLLPADFRDYPQYNGLPVRDGQTRAIDRIFHRGDPDRTREWRTEDTLRHFFQPIRPRRTRTTTTTADAAASVGPGEEVTVRVQGGDVVVEKRPTERGGHHG